MTKSYDDVPLCDDHVDEEEVEGMAVEETTEKCEQCVFYREVIASLKS